MTKKLISLLILVLTALEFTASGQAVKISCTEVMPDGDVWIHWDPLTVGSTFSDYKIYTSSHHNGPYSLLATILIMDQGTYLHTGAGANSDTLYYYIVTNQGAGGTIVTDTLATMLLGGTKSNFEFMDFAWSPLHEPLPFLPEMYPKYFLYREYPPGNWEIVDSTQNQTFNYHFWECNGDNDTVRFKIGVRNDNIGCISFSNQVGDVLNNLVQPDQVSIDSISISYPEKKIIIGWQPGQDLDIAGYIIYRVTATNDSIGYTVGKEASFFLHEDSDPCDGPIKYVLAAIDSCGNKSPLSFEPHTSVYLSDILYDPCQMTNRLSWNEYENFNPPLGYTIIYFSLNGGPYEVLDTLYPGETTYLHANLQPNTNYMYFVRAFSQDQLKSSTSCIKGVTTYNSPRPLFMYTRYVSVEDNERAIIMFYTDTNAHVQFYRILRSILPGGPYSEAGIVQNEGQEFIIFSDEDADVIEESYYYQVEVVDSCGVASVIANTSRTIFLEAEALPDLSNRLTWNAYESWSGRTLGYRVYRSLDDYSPDLLADVDSLTLTYTDNVSGLTGSISRITYFVEAYEGPGNAFGFQEQSISNEVLSEQEPKIFLPNAFAPHGLNNQLKPVCVFVGSEGYEFVVYNRWGQQIFRTKDPGEAWDGKYNGDYVQQDVYVYLVSFRNALNQPRQIKGNVVVLF